MTKEIITRDNKEVEAIVDTMFRSPENKCRTTTKIRNFLMTEVESHIISGRLYWYNSKNVGGGLWEISMSRNQ